ncbi:MAG: TolC family protein [Blastocatellia bacterium]
MDYPVIKSNLQGRGSPNGRKTMTVIACRRSGQGQALPLRLFPYSAVTRLIVSGLIFLLVAGSVTTATSAAELKNRSRLRRAQQQQQPPPQQPKSPPPGQQNQPQPNQPQQQQQQQQQPPGQPPQQPPPPGQTGPQQPVPPGQPPQTQAPTQQQQQQLQQQQPANPNIQGQPQQGAQPGAQQRVGDAGAIIPPQLPTAPPPVAPNYQAPVRPLPSAERVGVDVANQAALSLNEAIALALSNNNDINASRIDVEMSQFDLKAARGVFDPVLSSESYYERRVTPISSIIGGGANGKTTSVDATGNARLSGFSPFFGGNYQVDFTSSRTTTDNLFASLNPQFPSALTFTYTQPLFRGLRIDDNRRRIQIAKKNVSLTDAQFRQRAIETITRVQQAYWDLTFALRNLQVQIDAVKQARTQVESNRRQVEQGVLAPIDVVAADTQVTTFEQNVYVAQESVTRAENNLKSLMLANRVDPLWSRAILPVTPVTLEPPRVPIDQALTSALANRPELDQVKVSREINQINTRFYNDQTKPQIDLIGAYTATGLAGTPVERDTNLFSNQALQDRVNELSAIAGLPALPPSLPVGSISDALIGGYNQSLRNIFNQAFPTARAGIRFSFPVGNRTAEANYGRSLAEGRRIDTQRQQIEQQIETEVRNALQAVRSAEARLAAAASARSSSEQQYASEQRRFQAGLSTTFLVLQRQTDLTAAQGRELQAQTDLNKAIADFQRATGSTLQVNNITVRTDTPTRQLEHRAAASPE